MEIQNFDNSATKTNHEYPYRIQLNGMNKITGVNTLDHKKMFKWGENVQKNERGHLAELGVLSHLSDEDLSRVWSAHVFGVGAGLGALLLNTDDEVYYVGDYHALFCQDGVNNKDKVVKIKVNEISGLGIKRLGVGENVCVALTKQNGIHFWNSPIKEAVKKTPEVACVSFRVHSELPYEDTACPHCTAELCIHEVPGLKLAYCWDCDEYTDDGHINQPRNNRTVVRYPYAKTTNQTEGFKNVVKLVKFNNKVDLICTKCNIRACTDYEIGDRLVYYCGDCNYFPREADNFSPLKTKKEELQLIKLSESVDMIDLACGKDFFVLLTSQNDLILWGEVADLEYQGILYHPENVVAKAIFCGSNHVAVLSIQGELYTCGQGSMGQLGYKWTLDMGYDTLRQVPLEGEVTNVCCGSSSTVCLMSDGSLMCFGSHMKMLPSGMLALNQQKTDFVTGPAKIEGIKRVTHVVNCPGTNIFFAKTEDFVFTWGRRTIKSGRMQLVPSGGNLMAALSGLPASFTFEIRNASKSALRPHRDSDFYGKHDLSDLTLKLSDGDFPVHRMVLMANSVYFQDAFSKGDLKAELDMQNYNPKAYKCLLKYFYQVPPTNLNAPDLVDLYALATSYKEVEIAQEVFDKLKTALNSLTVLPILRKAKDVNCNEVLEECNAFISSPEFKHNLAEKVAQDPGRTMSLLEALEKN